MYSKSKKILTTAIANKVEERMRQRQCWRILDVCVCVFHQEKTRVSKAVMPCGLSGFAITMDEVEEAPFRLYTLAEKSR